MKIIYIQGVKTVLNKLIFSLLTINSLLLIIYISHLNLANNPEIKSYNNQTINLILTSKKCKSFNQKTLFFNSIYRNKSIEINEQYKIISYKNKKNSFVTYYMEDNIYLPYEDILLKNGLIKSDNLYGDNNIAFSLKAIRLISENDTSFIKNNYQKYYRILGFPVLKKDGLYLNYENMKKKFRDDFNFMPETYYYPHDKEKINKMFKNYTFNINNLWFVKPANLYGGKGISILESLDKIDKEQYIINKYITDLDLINKKKYDLRLYVLVSGLKPLRIYLYKDGLIRIASKNFSLDNNTIQNQFIHLTNICVNSKNKDFLTPNNTKIENSNLWNLHTYEKYLKKLNVDYEKMKKKIKDIIVKSLISVYKNLTSVLEQKNKNDNNFYILLGYDILVRKNYEPILIEINSSPMLKSFSELEKHAKTNLLVDTFNIIGISAYSKNIISDKIRQFNYNSEDNVNNAICELRRPKGDYELIFPLKDNIKIYKKYFENINSEENEIFWNKIIKAK